MGYPTVGITGQVGTWTGTLYSTLLAAITPATARIAMTNPGQDVTGLNTGVGARTAGLASWSGSLSGYAFATPALGNVGLLAYTSGRTEYTSHLDSLRVRIEAQPIDITEFNASAPTWRRFCPGISRWSATARAVVDSSTALVGPHVTSDSAATATFTYGGSGAQLSGSARVVSVSPAMALRANQKTVVDIGLEGTGTLAASGTGSIFGTYNFAEPEWDQGSSAPTSTTQPKIIVTWATSRTFTGCAFWTGIDLSWEVGSPVAIDVAFQGTGAPGLA